MSKLHIKKQLSWPSRIVVFFTILAFALSVTILPTKIQAQSILDLPVPGSMVNLSSAYNPVTLVGLTIDLEDPQFFDMIIHPGDTNLDDDEFKKESTKLIKYFLASLTVPDDEMWVNLSPYEKDRIIPEGFADTEMGRDLLAQDYMLKQLTASLMYPEEELGNEFWNRVYKRVNAQYGTAKIPMNTFNKVWIVPEKAMIYENGSSVFIVESSLKVMLEEDYLALESNVGSTKHGLGDVAKEDLTQVSKTSSKAIKEIIIPAIEKEVNSGETFVKLRQIYNAMILARWYKTNLKKSLLGQTYVDQNKTKGIDLTDKKINQKIYNQYVESFKLGVYDFIKEDYDPATQEIIPRKYFSGGVSLEGKNEVTKQKGVLAKILEVSKRIVFHASGLRDDVVISSSGTLLEGIAYNEKVVGKNKKILKLLAAEIEAEIPDDDDIDIDFRNTILDLLANGDTRVVEDSQGNVIVTLEENKRYLILTNRLDPITNERELIFIDPRFGADHAGRTRNQIYARDFARAVHEINELRVWKTIENDLLENDILLPTASYLDYWPRIILKNLRKKFVKAKNIRDWTRNNIVFAQLIDKFAHYHAGLRERQFVKKTKENAPDISKLENFLDYLEGINGKYIFSKVDSFKFYTDVLLNKFTPEISTFEEVLQSFDSDDKAIMFLNEQPSREQLKKFDDKLYEVLILKLKESDIWVAMRGKKVDKYDSLRSTLKNVIAQGGAKKKINFETKGGLELPLVSAVISFLNLNKVALMLHTHPRGVAPPSAADLFIGARFGKKHAVKDDLYFYTYVYEGPELSEEEMVSIENDLELTSNVLTQLSLLGLSEMSAEVLWERVGEIEDEFFAKWKAIVEEKGFKLKRYKLADFESDDEMYELIEDKSPIYEQNGAEDIIIKSRTEVKDNGLPLEAAADLTTSREDLGGIDLNPDILDLQTRGQNIDFNFKIDPEQIQNFNIDGVKPTIINITPVGNIPFLLGQN